MKQRVLIVEYQPAKMRTSKVALQIPGELKKILS